MLCSNNLVIEDLKEPIWKLKVAEGQTISVIYNVMYLSGPKKWYRFKEWRKDDYQCIYANCDRDAMSFIPKKNIYFYGFGFFGLYNGMAGRDAIYTFQWRLGEHGHDYKSKTYDVTLKWSDLNEEKHDHLIDIRELGEDPMLVEEGQKLHLLVYRAQSDSCYVGFGYSGSQDAYSTIEGQEYDFETGDSNWTNNSTRGDWGCFPFIYYAPA